MTVMLNCCIAWQAEAISKRLQERMGFIVRGYYPESLYAFSPLLRLWCWGVSAASRHAGCPVTQGRTLQHLRTVDRHGLHYTISKSLLPALRTTPPCHV
jgi:hypothetical protein